MRTLEIKKMVAEKLLAQRQQVLVNHAAQAALACYVSPQGHSAVSREHTSALQPWVEKEFLHSDTQVLLLKGAGGSGKSTFNQQLLYTLWQDKAWDEFKPGDVAPRALVPIWIPLGSHTVDPERLFNYLSQLPKPFTEEEINILKSDYRLLLITDGYDEMPGARQINLYDANQLGRYDGRVKLLISARIEEHVGEESTYFVPHQVDGRLVWPLYKERYVAAFNPSQRAEYITQYLAKHKQEKDHPLWPDVATYERHFSEIPGIEPLLTTPFVLMMAVETLPGIVAEVDVTLVKDSKESEKKSAIINPVLERLQLTRAKLYDQFMAAWFSRQAEKAIAADQSLKDPEKILGSELVAELKTQTSTEPLAIRLLKRGYAEFCQNLAQHLQTQGRSTLRYPVEEKYKGRVAKKIIEEESPKEQTVQPDSALSLSILFSKAVDRALIRQGCPLRQERSNEYSFLHTSFIDYFVTTLIYQQVTKQPEEKTIISEPPSLSIVEKSGTVKEKKVEVVEDTVVEKTVPVHKKGRLAKKTRSSNPLTQRLMARESIQFLADRVDQDEKFARSLWDWIECSKSDEETSTITAAANAITILNAANKSFSDKDFNGIRISGADLTGGIFHGTQLKNADLTGVNFTDAHLEEVDFSGSMMKDLILNERSVLKAHSMPIRCMAYEQGSDIAATGSGMEGKDCGIRIWDIKQSQLIDILVGHTDEVIQVLFRPQQKELRLISLSNDSTIREWDIKAGKEIRKWSNVGWLMGVASISSNGQYLAITQENLQEAKETTALLMYQQALMQGEGNITEFLLLLKRNEEKQKKSSHLVSLWDLAEGVLKHSFAPHIGELISLQWGPFLEDKLLVTNGTDKRLKLWNLNNLKQPKLVWQKESACSLSLLFTPDGSGILADEPTGIIYRDSKTGERGRLYHAQGLKDTICSMAVDSSGQYISASDQTNIEIWDIQTGHSLTVLFGHSAQIGAMAFSSKMLGLLISASHDGTIRQWPTDRFLYSKMNQFHHTQEITSLILSQDEKILISGSLDSHVKFWHPKTGSLLKALSISTAGITAMTLLPYENELIVGDSAGTIYRIDMYTLKKIAVLTNQHVNAITCLSSFQNGWVTQLVSGSSDCTIRLWDLKTNTFIRKLESKQAKLGVVKTVWFSSAGQSVYSLDNRIGGIKWEVATGKMEQIVADGVDAEYLSKSLGEKKLISAHKNNDISIWNIDSMKRTHILKGHTSTVKMITITQNDEIISGDEKGEILIWDQDYKLQARCMFPSSVKQLVVRADQSIYVSGTQHSILAYQLMPSGSTAAVKKTRLIWRQGSRFYLEKVKTEKLQQLSALNWQILQAQHELSSMPNLEELSSELRPYQHYALDKDGNTALIRAIKNKNEQGIMQLIRSGVDVNHTVFDDWTPLQMAVHIGHLAGIKLLLENNAKIGQTGFKTASPLHIASQQGNDLAIKMLLEYKAVIKESADSPLHVAAAKGHFFASEVLLKHKADVNLSKKNGETPLLLASQNGHERVIEVLIENKAMVNQPVKDGSSPLFFASAEGHILAVKLLLDKNAKVNQSNIDGGSPLYIAAQAGHNAVIETLIDYKADINQSTKNGSLPICVVAQGGHDIALKTLLKYKADVNYKNPLYLAAQHGHITTLKILLEHKANINQPHLYGYAPLSIASENGHEVAISTLLEYKANINQANERGSSPLSLAAQRKRELSVKFLLECKAEVNQANKGGASPLYFAALSGSIFVANILLEYKADVNQACTSDEASPLCVAAQERHSAIIKLLLNAKARVNHVKEDGCSPLFSASQNGDITSSPDAPTERPAKINCL